MATERKALDQIKIASPCTASWNQMKGDDQVRFCGECQQNVYNLSSMSLPQISQLLEKKEGRTCVRFYRRPDGTVLTDDCPVGLRAVRRRLAMVAAAAGTLLSALGFGMWMSRGAMARTLKDSSLGRIQIVRDLADWMEPRRAYPLMGSPMPLLGRVAMPSCGTGNTPTPGSPAVMGNMMPVRVQRPQPSPR